MITNTTLFLLPVFQIPERSLQNNGFKNAYLKDVDKDFPEDDNLVYALFKPSETHTFEKLREELEAQDFVYQDYDYENGYVVLVLIFPEAFAADFKLIREGKYSKTSEAFRQLFPSKQIVREDESEEGDASFHYRVFYKMDILKHRLEESLGIRVHAMGPDFEYWEGWNDDKETLNISKIIAAEKPPVATEIQQLLEKDKKES